MAKQISAAERAADRSATEANFGLNIRALTQHVLRQGSSLLTRDEAQSEAIRLYRTGLRASDVMGF